MSTIHFKTKPFKIGPWTILLVPKDASAKLPSRGIVMIKGTINGFDFQTALEPDGRGSHWFRVDADLAKAANAAAGDIVTLAIESTKEWTEPEVPADIAKALAADKQAHALWEKITPMAHREWIRWIRATNKDETRKNRIEVARSKMRHGERRPCCFNSSMCTEPSVSKSGVLLEPTQ
jgi:hypothetical protein